MSTTRSDKIEQLFLELIDLPVDQREARLDELCNGDAPLRDELFRLLAADESRSGNDDSGIVGGFVSDPVPQRVGQYVVNGIAGEGGDRQQSAQRLAQTEKLAGMGRLAASIAHEINNPLQAVQNSLHLLANRCEQVYGPARDVEWAFAGGALYLLQCRAITKAGR